MLEISTGHIIPKSIAIEAIPTYIKTNHSQRGDANHVESMSLTPITTTLLSDLDRVTVEPVHIGNTVYLKWSTV